MAFVIHYIRGGGEGGRKISASYSMNQSESLNGVSVYGYADGSKRMFEFTCPIRFNI
jgi:hypothetical protein